MSNARQYLRTGFGICLLLCLLAGLGCGNKDEADKARHRKPGSPLLVTTTTPLLADLVRQVGGDWVTIEVVLEPGANPHTFQATKLTLSKLAECDVLVFHGLGFEAGLAADLEEVSRNTRLLDVAADIPQDRLQLLPGEEEIVDPHIWGDVTLWMLAVARVRQAFMELDPDHQGDFDLNARNYVAKLSKLHSELSQQIGTIPTTRRMLVSGHAAFGYFGKAYGIQSHGLYGVDATTPTPAVGLQNLANLVAQRQVPAIFSEPNLTAEVCREFQASVGRLGHTVQLGDLLFPDGPSPTDSSVTTYIDMMRTNGDRITRALTAGANR
ncbi:MAG: metal ABC transporter substrate-binding protein [bacterium]